MVGDVFAAAKIFPPGIMKKFRKIARRQISRFRRLLPDWILVIVRIMPLLSRFDFQIALPFNLLDGQLVKVGQILQNLFFGGRIIHCQKDLKYSG